MTAYPLHLPKVPYGDLPLQTIDICLARAPPSSLEGSRGKGYWIIYIHGGAWRDPLQTTQQFEPAQDALLESSPSPTDEPFSRVAGLASLNYRLSPHPDFPVPEDDSMYPSRTARHPDHIHDVVVAIRFLQRKYGFGREYVLVGHSCGATLAYQVAMGSWNGFNPTSALWDAPAPAPIDNPSDFSGSFMARDEGPMKIAGPAAVVGLCGIYDIPLLVENHGATPVYEDFVTGAFGKSSKVREEVSPARFPAYRWTNAWEEGRIAVVASSQSDELVEEAQSEKMTDVLLEAFSKDAGRQVDVWRRVVHGTHNGVFEDGKQVADLLLQVIGRLVEHDDRS